MRMRASLKDPDVRHSLLFAVLLIVASGGLAYVWYLARVVRIAWRTPTRTEGGDCALVFGRALEPDGSVGTEYAQRLERAHALVSEYGIRRLVLMGGPSGGGRSEAAAGHAHLDARVAAYQAEILLEDRSLDTLQNLRNARELLGQPLTEHSVVLVSSRSHLARCDLLARELGFRARLCAAEPRLRLTGENLLRIPLEAGYISWLSLGMLYARVTRNQRLLQRLR